MPRLIDPSELEGDDLTNWYLRSPAEVEAEREGARQDQYDSFVRSIGDAAGGQNEPATRAQDATAVPAPGGGDDGANPPPPMGSVTSASTPRP